MNLINPDLNSKEIIQASPSLAGAWSAFQATPISARAGILRDVAVERFGDAFFSELTKLQDGRQWSVDELAATCYTLGRAEGRAGVPFAGGSGPATPQNSAKSDVGGAAEESISEGERQYQAIHEPNAGKRRELLRKFNAEPDAEKRGKIWEEMQALPR